MTVMRACGKCERIARSAGRLMTTSPSWPKSITRMLRGLNVTSSADRRIPRRLDMRAANPDAAKSHESHRERLALQSRLRWLAGAGRDSPSAQTQHCDHRHRESGAPAISTYPLMKLGTIREQSE